MSNSSASSKTSVSKRAASPAVSKTSNVVRRDVEKGGTTLSLASIPLDIFKDSIFKYLSERRILAVATCNKQLRQVCLNALSAYGYCGVYIDFTKMEEEQGVSSVLSFLGLSINKNDQEIGDILTFAQEKGLKIKVIFGQRKDSKEALKMKQLVREGIDKHPPGSSFVLSTLSSIDPQISTSIIKKRRRHNQEIEKQHQEIGRINQNFMQQLCKIAQSDTIKGYFYQNLTRLDFSLMEVYDEETRKALADFIQPCVNLTELSFGSLYGQSIDLSEYELLKLQKLSFNSVFDQLKLPLGLENLQELSLGDVYHSLSLVLNLQNLTTWSFGDISDKVDLSKCVLPKVQKLSFENIEEKGRLDLSQCMFPVLEELSFKVVQGLLKLPLILDNLHRLSFERIWREKGPLDLSQCFFKNLKELYFGQVSTRLLLPLNLPNLKKLFFEDIGTYAECLDFRQCIFPNLEELSFGGIYGCKLLLSLDLDNLKKLFFKGKGVPDLRQCFFKNLKEFHGGEISSSSLLPLNFPNLEILSFEYITCEGRSSFDLSQCVFQCLQEISFKGVRGDKLVLPLNLDSVRKLSFGTLWDTTLDLRNHSLANLEGLTYSRGTVLLPKNLTKLKTNLEHEKPDDGSEDSND